MDARKVLLIFVNKGVGALLGLAGLFFVGRYMDPTVYGMLGFGLALVGLTTVITDLGLGSAHVKRISEGRDLATCIGTFLRMKLRLVIGSTALLLAAVLGWHLLFGFEDATTLPVLLVLVAYHFLHHLRVTLNDTFRGLRETAKEEWVSLWDTVVRVALVVAVAIAYGAANGFVGPLGEWPIRAAERLGLEGPWSRQQGAFYLALAFAAGVAVSLAIAAGIFRRHGYPIGRYDRELARSYWRFAFPMALIGAVGVLANQMDTVMVGYFWTSTEVGYYFTAQRLVLLFAVIPAAVGVLFFPLMSELATRRAHEGVHAVARSAQRLLLLVTLPILLGMVLYSQGILHVLVGDRFLPAAPILVLLSINTVVQSVAVVGGGILRGFDLPRLAAVFGVLNVGLNAILNVVLIPDSVLGVPMLGLRAEGAAMATLIAQTVSTVVLVVASRRLAGDYLLRPYLLRQAAAFTLAGAAVLALRHIGLLPPVERLWDLLGQSLLAVTLHILALIVLRELTRRDARYFLDLLSPGKMAHYVREELRGPRR